MKRLAFAVLAVLLPAAAAAGDGGCRALELTGAVEAKIQAQVLDAILGPKEAYAFLELKAELTDSAETSGREGAGETRKTLPADPKARDGAGEQGQTARQTKGSSESRTVLGFAPVSMKLRVLHDSAVPAEKLKAVKAALTALFPGSLKPEDIVFVPAPFDARAK